MAKVFCQNCGAQGDAGAPFCGNCGAKMPAPQQQQAQQQQPQQQQPQQQWQPPPPQQQQPQQQQWQPQQQQQPQQQRQPQQQQWQQQQWQQPPQQKTPYAPGGQYPQQYPYAQMPPTAKKSKKGLMTGLIIGGVVLVAAIVLIVVLGGGGGGGAVLKDVRHSELKGDYKGTVTIKNVKFDSGFKDFAESLGIDLDELEELKDLKGKEIKCDVYLGDDYLELTAAEDLFFGGDEIELDDVKFVKGVAEGKEVEDEDGMSSKMEYKITAHEGKKSDYRLYGVATMEMKFDIKSFDENFKGSFSMEIVFDVESK